MANIRLLAIRALSDITAKRRKPKDAIDSCSSGLERRDRAFLMEIVYGVVRYRLTIDWILARFLKTPARLADFTMLNLLCALYQLQFMRVPDWAAVNEAVETEKSYGTSRNASLVNAVLRNFLRRKEEFRLPLHSSDTATDISLNTSTPVWLVNRWIRRYGENACRELCEANNRVPALCIRTNTLRSTRDELIGLLASNNITAEPTLHSPEGVIVHDIHAFSDLACAHGLFLVQDEASQLIGHLLSPAPGDRVLDVCAAPGGKTTHLAQLMNDTGEIVAVEKEPHRMTVLNSNISQVGVTSVRPVTADLLDLDDLGLFDRILIDAPCTSIGVIRKNPDVKYRHRERDMRDFHNRQLELLRHASQFLKPGGTLVYSVCSTEPEEGEDVIGAFLKTAGDFRIIETDSGILREFCRNGFYRTYPHLNGMDGFFGARLCKKV